MAKAQSPPITVTAFGKHPAWADHIDNLPTPGPRLPQFKSLLYTNGIDPNVRRWTRTQTQDAAEDVHSPVLDSDKQDPAAGLIRFDHRFRWWNADALIVGKLIPSSDLKQRRKYPLVLAVQCVGVAPEWVRQHAWPVLDPLGVAVRQAASADEVRALLDQAGQTLNAEWESDAQPASLPNAADASAPPCSPVPVGLDAVQALVGHFAPDPPADAPEPAPPIEVVRLLYQFQRITRSAARPEDWPGSHLRVPALTDDHLADLTLYQNVARHLTDGRVAVLAIAPDGQDWIDLILGHPDPSYFLCLRRDNLPYCTEIAYNLDDDETAGIHAIIRGAPPLPPGKDPASGIFNLGSDRPKTGIFKIKQAEETSDGPKTSDDGESAPPPRRGRSDPNIKLMLGAIGGLLFLIVVLLVVLFGGL